MNQQTQSQADLSSKNLTILEDQMNHEASSYKKLNVYSNQCQDQQVKSIIQKAAGMHKQHFDRLYNYLNSHNKPVQ